MSLIKSTKASLVNISFLFDCVYIYFSSAAYNPGGEGMLTLRASAIVTIIVFSFSFKNCLRAQR